MPVSLHDLDLLKYVPVEIIYVEQASEGKWEHFPPFPPLNQEEFHPCSMDLQKLNEILLREAFNPDSIVGCSQIHTLGPCQLPVAEPESLGVCQTVSGEVELQEEG